MLAMFTDIMRVPSWSPIRSAPGLLPHLAFDGATKRNKPNLKVRAWTNQSLLCGGHILTLPLRPNT